MVLANGYGNTSAGSTTSGPLSALSRVWGFEWAASGGPEMRREIGCGGGGGDSGAAEEIDRDGDDDGGFQGSGAEGTNRPLNPEKWLAMTRVQRKHQRKQGGQAL